MVSFLFFLVKMNAPASEEQKSFIVDYMFDHPEFAAGKFQSGQGKVTYKEIWKSLQNALNKIPGAHKTDDQWAQVIYINHDFKIDLKNRFNIIRITD